MTRILRYSPLKKKARFPNTEEESEKGEAEYRAEIKNKEEIEELRGKLATQFEKKLMHSVLEDDKKVVEEGKFVRNAINQGMTSFTPDMLFENITKNYNLAKNIFGEAIIRFVTGYDSEYVKNNITVPEFKRELKKRIENNISMMKKEGLLDNDLNLTEKSVELASLINYVEELDNITPKGIQGEKIHKKSYIYGDKENTRDFKKGFRYRDIAIKKSVKQAIRRSHSSLEIKDLKAYEKQSKGRVCVIYGLDASGSMKGEKIATAKKAGIALAYKAIQEKDRVGLIVFNKDVKVAIEPTYDFSMLIKEMTKIRASSETDFGAMIQKAVQLFPASETTKHLIVMTDAMPTVGEFPEKAAVEQAGIAASNGITISIVGITLNKKGEELAKKIVEIGKGKFYKVRALDELDKIILEDYYSLM